MSYDLLSKRLGHKRFKFALLVVGLLLVLSLLLIGGLPALSLVSRVLFVLFLPGFSILQAVVSDKFGILEKMILAPVLGMAYTSLITLLLSFLNVPINWYTIVLSVVLLSVPLLVYSWRRGVFTRTSLEPHPGLLTCFILLGLLAVSFASVALPLPGNGILIPLGDDPATSTLAAAMIAEQGRIPQSWAPYFPEQAPFTFPPGYPSVVAFLYLLDKSMSLPVLVTLFSSFFVLLHGEIFVLTRRVMHDDRIALCAAAVSVLFSFGFYNVPALFGFYQMITNGRFPALMGMSLTLGLLLFSYIYSVSGNRKMLLLGGVMLGSLFVTYTVSYITVGLFLILFFALELIFFQNKRRSVFGFLTIAVLGIAFSVPWVLNFFGRLMVQVPAAEYQALLAWFNIFSVRGEFGPTNLLVYYGYWIVLSAVAGFLLVSVKKKAGSFLLAWFLSIFLLMLNEMLKIPFPSWYYLQSGAFLNPKLAFPLSVISGIGLLKVYDFLKKRFQFISYRLVKISPRQKIVAAALLLAVFFSGTITVISQARIQPDRISIADYDAIMWISNNTSIDAVIFNDHWVGSPSVWIPVMSHRRIVMPLLSLSEVGWTDLMLARQSESYTLATRPDSTEALSILEKYDVSYIYLSNRVSGQVEVWRNNYDVDLFLHSSHYKVEFNEENAWIFSVIY